jgi:hypothetical protein
MAAEDGTAFVECDAHVLLLCRGLAAFLEANGAEAARISRKTADIELGDAQTHKWRAYGKDTRSGTVVSLTPNK